MKYKLYTYDLWGNDKDGYQINDYYGQDEFDINESMTDKQIFKIIGIKPQSQNHVEFDDHYIDSDTLYIIAKKNSKPLCELRRINQ